MGLSSGFDEPIGNLASNDEINNNEELPNDISEFLLENTNQTHSEFEWVTSHEQES